MNGWRLIACAVFALACLAGFLELAEDFAYSRVVAAFDLRVSSAVWSLRAPALTWLMKLVTLSAGTVSVIVLTAGITLALVRRGERRLAVFTVVLVAGGELLSWLAKGRFERLRPPASTALVELPSSYSFPSGHTMASLCLAVAVGVIVVRLPLPARTKTIALAAVVAWAVAVGLSRIYLGVHFPSDVLASWLLGGAWAALVTGVAWDRLDG